MCAGSWSRDPFSDNTTNMAHVKPLYQRAGYIDINAKHANHSYISAHYVDLPGTNPDMFKTKVPYPIYPTRNQWVTQSIIPLSQRADRREAVGITGHGKNSNRKSKGQQKTT